MGIISLDPAVQIILIPVLIFALSFHEFAHAWAAYRLGDSTAASYGRLTLNPLAHLDPFGAIVLYLAGFGWAKPVPVDARYLENPRRDMLWIALAGPVSNLIVAAVSGLLLRILWGGGLINGSSVLTTVLVMSLQINLALAFFNFLPVPPLDGSRIMAGLIPARNQSWLYNLEIYGPRVLFGLILLGVFTGVSVIWWVIGPFIKLFMTIFTLGMF